KIAFIRMRAIAEDGEERTMSISTLLRPHRLTEIVDIGAGARGINVPAYKPMLDAGLCRVTGFEPHPEAVAQLLRTKGSNERCLQFVVGDGKRHGFNIYASRSLSSLFEIDPRIFDCHLMNSGGHAASDHSDI